MLNGVYSLFWEGECSKCKKKDLLDNFGEEQKVHQSLQHLPHLGKFALILLLLFLPFPTLFFAHDVQDQFEGTNTRRGIEALLE